MLLAAGVGLLVCAPVASEQLLVFTRRVLSMERGGGDLPFVMVLARDGMRTFFAATMPLLGILAGVALAANVAQVGFLFTTHPLKPNLQKLNPVGRFSELFFSARAVMEALKAAAKLVAVGLPLYLAMSGSLAQVAALVGLAPADVARAGLEEVTRVTFWVAGVFVVISILDYGFQRYSIEKKMRMTHQEAKQEQKEELGDPHVKGRIRQIQREMAFNRMMADVPKADVVVTNPTHFAVALRYRRDEGDAPRVLAKGKDRVALRIREAAFRHGVPIVPNPPLARALYAMVKVGRFVPQELFRAVAEVLAYVYRRRGGAPVADDAPRRAG